MPGLLGIVLVYLFWCCRFDMGVGTCATARYLARGIDIIRCFFEMLTKMLTNLCPTMPNADQMMVSFSL